MREPRNFTSTPRESILISSLPPSPDSVEHQSLYLSLSTPFFISAYCSPEEGGCKSPTEAFGILVWRIRKRLGVAMVLANARFILERVQWVGPGSIAAAERRKRARQRFYDPTTGVSSLRHQYRRATRTPSPYSKFGLMPIPEVNL